MSHGIGLEDLSVIEALKSAYAPDGGDVREHNADQNGIGFGLLHYAFVRNLQPEHALALGSRYGFVPACIALALKANGKGRLHFVDANYDDRTDCFRTAYGGTGYWRKPASELFATLDLSDWIDVFVERTDSFFARASVRYGYVYVDADHSYQGVKYDFEQALQHLTPGGLVTFHDALVDTSSANKVPDPGAFGIKQFLREHFPEALVLDRWPGLAIVQPRRVEEPEASSAEITQLRRQLAVQQEQLEALRTKMGLLDTLSSTLEEATVKLNDRLVQQDAYYELIARIRTLVREHVPKGSTVLVVSKGDDQLVCLENQHAWHFPQDPSGVYAGEHPKDSAEAISLLNGLRAKGAQYLLFPKTMFWWFESYPEFKAHLDRSYKILTQAEATGVLYWLCSPVGSKTYL
jgi:predicted O-methyltransferase YrrM